jgi:hypothetical protein
VAEINPLLTLGLGILGANQPSRAPNPFLSVLGRGGINAMQMMQQQQAAATRKAQAEAAMEYQKANQERMTAKTEQERRAAELAATDRTAFGALGADADVTNPEVRRLYRSQGLDPSFGFDKKKQWLLRDGNTVYDTFQAGDKRAPKQATPPAATSQERNYRNLLRKGVSHAEAMRLSYGVGDTAKPGETERLMAQRDEIERKLASGTVTNPLEMGQLRQRLATINGILEKKGTVVGQTPTDAAEKAARRVEGKAAGERQAAGSAQVEKSAADISRIDSFIQRVVPGVTGLRGYMASSGAAGVGEQYVPELTHGLLKIFGASTPAETKAYQADAAVLAADLVRTVTPERGARISDYEFKLSQSITGFDSATSSVETIKSTLQTLQKINAMKGLRGAVEAGNPLDITDVGPDGAVQQFAGMMLDAGMSDTDIEEVLKEYKTYLKFGNIVVP